MFRKLLLAMCFALSMVLSPAVRALDEPWISDTYFYWYQWDYAKELGSWMGGVHNTPLSGYYDSRTFADNRRSLWQASEWGITHHFMDYWSPTWKDEHGEMREKTVMRAAEALRTDGYTIWMSYYQDGDNFEMKEFSKNVSEKRDVHQWLRDFAKSPVWPRVNGCPYQLVYGRNGRPKTTKDDEGFRGFLRSKYADIAALNQAWGTTFKSFDEVQMAFTGKGFQRALSIRYQYEIWRKEWARLDDLVKKEFGLPGVRVSFDVGYKPFMGFGYSDFARVFGGPHSYGGIFKEPQDQDAERFIQAAVAKKYNTIFFDHFKNYYHDWEFRIPGFAYLPDPFHFDRFWVGALMRHSEALLHLSWNEWWEGSNLEPCEEFGKTYPQKNLFYSTLMQLCFPSIRQSTADAEVVVLLNDWCFLAGGGYPDDLYRTLQTLRRLNVTFDLLPDDFVTEDALKNARLVVAPQCGTGLGVNSSGERIADVIWRWISSGRDRRLISSCDARMRERLGLRLAPRAASRPARPGPDLNVFVDLGAEGDEAFIVEGAAGRENWKTLPAGVFGAGLKCTIRWTPAEGRATTLRLPASPGRDHVLRFAGAAVWPNSIRVLVDQNEVGTLKVEPNYREYSLAVPAKWIGNAKTIELSLVYQESRVPAKMDPQHYPKESKVCNLALDWVQFSTSNVPAKRQQQQYVMPKSEIELTADIFKDLRGRKIECSTASHDRLDAEGSAVLSRYVEDSAPHGIVRGVGENSVLYVGGSLSDVSHSGWWAGVLRNWAGVACRPVVVPARAGGDDLNVMSARISAGESEIVLAANHDVTKRQDIVVTLPTRSMPLSEVVALSRDGKTFVPLIPRINGQAVSVSDAMQYYGVYQFAFAPVRVTGPAFVLDPGERRDFPVTVRNLTEKPVSGTLCARSVIPTLVGAPRQIALGPAEEREVPLTLEAKTGSDWGVKTFAIELDFDGHKAYLFRDVTVLAPPDLRATPRIVVADNAVIEVQNKQNRLITNADAEDVTAAIISSTGQLGAALPLPEQVVKIGTLTSGQKAKAEYRLSPASIEKASLESKQLVFEYKCAGRPCRQVQKPFLVAACPKEYEKVPGALAAVVVFNGGAGFADHALARCDLKRLRLSEKGACVRDGAGTLIPSQLSESGEIVFPVIIPPLAGQVFTICEGGGGQAPGDLRVGEEALGTGHGRLRVSNCFYSLTLDEAKGGTVTEFRSAATGRDYAAGSLGVTYGTFGNYDATKPAVTTPEFIQESRTRQSSRPGRITLVTEGPLLAVATVEWSDRNITVTQSYEFGAHQRHLLLRETIKPAPTLRAQEIVALDARFTPHALCKTYPNFVGITPKPGELCPQYGWRYGNWIPDYLTIMEQTGFEESISIVPIRHTGLDQVRQGFWPPERPKPGPRTFAEIELISHKIGPIRLDAYVLLHPGYQIAAKQFREDIENPLVAVLVESPKWRPSSIRALPTPRADWFDAFWHYRTPIVVSMPAGAPPFAEAEVRLEALVPGKKIDEGSLRLVRVDARTNSWTQVPFAFDKGEGKLRWRADGAPQGNLFLYFDLESNGVKPAARQVSVGRISIEAKTPLRESDEWALDRAEVQAKAGPDGKDAVRLLCPEESPHSLLSHRAIFALPKTRYKVSFMARAPKPVTVHTNLYEGARYDFPHGMIPVAPGSEWRRHETEIQTREFPETVRPVLRIWVTEKDKEVLLSEISVQPVLPQGTAKVSVGKVETTEGK